MISHVARAHGRRVMMALVQLGALWLGAACGKEPAPAGIITGVPVDSTVVPPTIVLSRSAIYDWNARASFFAYLMGTNAPLPATYEAQIYAMVNGAIHDAVNAIVPRYKSFAYTYGYVPRTVEQYSPQATVATAAFTILETIGLRLATDPSAQNTVPLVWVRSEYANEMERIVNGPAKQAGIALGRDVAAAMMSVRPFVWANPTGMSTYVSTGGPGEYRPTSTFTTGTQGIAGAAAWASWAQSARFVLKGSSQFRAASPYGVPRLADAVRTPRYSTDFDEVSRLGGVTSDRTDDQTELAYFWDENPPLAWNRVARIVAIENELDAWDTARLLALVSFGQADANIVAYDTKYAFPFWRPITAIRSADIDGNADTESDSTWDVSTAPYGLPTPPTPEYSSAHAIAGGAAATIIEGLIPGPTAFSMQSTVLPGVIRSFESVAGAAKENADSRVYIGYHFRHSTEIGLLQGNALGRFVLANALPRIR